jgi:hypothetical protein
VLARKLLLVLVMSQGLDNLSLLIVRVEAISLSILFPPVSTAKQHTEGQFEPHHSKEKQDKAVQKHLVLGVFSLTRLTILTPLVLREVGVEAAEVVETSWASLLCFLHFLSEHFCLFLIEFVKIFFLLLILFGVLFLLLLV